MKKQPHFPVIMAILGMLLSTAYAGKESEFQHRGYSERYSQTARQTNDGTEGASQLELDTTQEVDATELFPEAHAGGDADTVPPEQDAASGGKKDTVLIITEHTAANLARPTRERDVSARVQGYGGALSFNVSGIAVDMENTVKKLIRSDSVWSKVQASIEDKEFFPLFGGLGFGGVGNGIRIGGGGWGGSSDRFEITIRNPGEEDTIYTLDVSLGMGGFLLEKAIVAGDFNLFFGGMIGGGSMTVTPIKTVSGGSSIFSGSGPGSSDSNSTIGQELDAGFMLLEAHAGISYSILSWMHIGGDFTAPFFISSNGFKDRSPRLFQTFNPGFRFRFLLGNLG
ncbi:MAG: hypothetical protein GF398_12125 [Chitinivibrionales bacterium]|nr:hypothetical protein [Chitinivibrionales bacterium]